MSWELRCSVPDPGPVHSLLHLGPDPHQEGSGGPLAAACPCLQILSLGCWDSQGGLNEGKLIAGDSFGPDSTTELREGEDGETRVWPEGCWLAMPVPT